MFDKLKYCLLPNACISSCHKYDLVGKSWYASLWTKVLPERNGKGEQSPEYRHQRCRNQRVKDQKLSQFFEESGQPGQRSGRSCFIHDLCYDGTIAEWGW